MDKRYQVFVSSTFRDLQEERRAVIQTLMDMNCIPSGMESFPAIDAEVWSYIKRAIDESDYYLLIVGGLYGSLAPDGISYTEKEFDYAVETNKRIIALLHSAPDEIPAKFTENNQVAREKLQAFCAKIQTGRLVRYWKTADEVVGKVATSLLQTMNIFPAEGWVRGNQAASVEILNELNETRKKKDELETEVIQLRQRLEGTIFTPNEMKEFENLQKILNREIEFRCKARILKLVDNDSFLQETTRIDIFRVHFLDFLLYYLKAFSFSEFDTNCLDTLIDELASKQCVDEKKEKAAEYKIDYAGAPSTKENIVLELITYGLLKSRGRGGVFDEPLLLPFCEKMYRFRYWLDYNGYTPNANIVKFSSGELQ